eukprot:SM000111S18816  [mRNA]  locus=s111:400245:400883:+ [translate_table: standard]
MVLEMLEDITGLDVVLNLTLREDVLVSKCLGRRICSECSGNFNLANIDVDGGAGSARVVMPPLPPPAACLHKMTVRADDTEDVIRARLEVYHLQTKPVEDFYRQRGLLLEFPVEGGIPETWPRLLAALQAFETDALEPQPRAA